MHFTAEASWDDLLNKLDKTYVEIGEHTRLFGSNDKPSVSFSQPLIKNEPIETNWGDQYRGLDRRLTSGPSARSSFI